MGTHGTLDIRADQPMARASAPSSATSGSTLVRTTKGPAPAAWVTSPAHA